MTLNPEEKNLLEVIPILINENKLQEARTLIKMLSEKVFATAIHLTGSDYKRILAEITPSPDVLNLNLFFDLKQYLEEHEQLIEEQKQALYHYTNALVLILDDWDSETKMKQLLGDVFDSEKHPLLQLGHSNHPTHDNDYDDDPYFDWRDECYCESEFDVPFQWMKQTHFIDSNNNTTTQVKITSLPKVPKDSGYYTTREAAELLNTSIGEQQRKCHQGEYKNLMKVNYRWQIPYEQVNDIFNLTRNNELQL